MFTLKLLVLKLKPVLLGRNNLMLLNFLELRIISHCGVVAILSLQALRCGRSQCCCWKGEGVLDRVGEDVEGKQEGRKERRTEKRKRGKKKRGIDVCILCGLSMLGT